jgi:hypothetical protein
MDNFELLNVIGNAMIVAAFFWFACELLLAGMGGKRYGD